MLTSEGLIPPITVNGLTLCVKLKTETIVRESGLKVTRVVYGSAGLPVPLRRNGVVVYATHGGGEYVPHE